MNTRTARLLSLSTGAVWLVLTACGAANEGNEFDATSRASNAGGTGAAAGTGGTQGTTPYNPGGSGGSASASSGGAGGETCGSVGLDSTVETVVQPGNVLVIFDRSDSMAEDFTTPNGCKPKHVAAGEALIDAITPIADRLFLGALLFPSSSKLALCSAVVDPIWMPSQISFRWGPDFVQAWSFYWQTNDLVLGTPLNRAFDAAHEALVTTGLVGKTAVVLFTDGEPVCTEGMSAPQRAAMWLSMGIRTYVVGLPGAQGVTLLDDIAVQGGTGGYLLPADSAALELELAAIAETTVSTTIADCLIHFDAPPPNHDDVHLVVMEAGTNVEYEVPRDDPNGDGWTLSPDGTAATILGNTCADAKQGRFSEVRFEFGCVELPVLPK